MWNRIEVAAEIRVYNLSMAGVEQLVDLPHGIQRTAVWPIGVLFRLQVGLVYRFDHQHCRRTGCGRYVLFLSSCVSSSNHFFTPYSSMSSNVWLSTPAAPRFAWQHS